MNMKDLATVPLPLTPVEAEDLHNYEATIQRGLNTYYAVGTAFIMINAKKLYRADYRTFEDYCRGKWNIGRAYAYRMIAAAEVQENLLPIGDKLPETESQARALVGLEPDQQRQVWQKVVDTAPNGKVTAQHIKDVRQVEIPIPEPEPAPVQPPNMIFRNCDTCKQRSLVESDAVINGTYVCHYCLAKEDDAPAAREPEIEEQIIDVYDQIDKDLQAIDEREPEAVIKDSLGSLCAACGTEIVPGYEIEDRGKFYHPNCRLGVVIQNKLEPEPADTPGGIWYGCDFCGKSTQHAYNTFKKGIIKASICRVCAWKAADYFGKNLR